MAANNDNGQTDASRARRGSFTQQTFQNIFGRSNSTSGPAAPFPGPITTAAAQDQRRRMSITTLGLSSTSPSNHIPFPFGGRRGSVSTAGSESLDENAIDDDEPGRNAPATPFTRRMSFGAQAMRSVRGSGGGGSPNTSGRGPSSLPSIPSGPRSSRALSNSQNGGDMTPDNQASTQPKSRTPSDLPVSARSGEGNGFNWSEQLRSRAESQSQRASFSTSPNAVRAVNMPAAHDRSKSISEMPAPPTNVPTARVQPERKKPDAFQERILKGDFYMD